MRTPIRLAGFGVLLAAVLGAGYGVGAAIGPDAPAVEAEAPAPIGEGVVAAADGYRLVPIADTLPTAGGPLRFTVQDQDGDRVTQYEAIHERDLHLIVVNRGLTVFHHVHPVLGDDGVWSVDLPALAPGSYRAVADFQIARGPRLALGVDLAVPGSYEVATLRDPEPTTTVDGYEVTLGTERGKGGEVTATLTVRKDGQVVEDLDPYLGAKGHLVAMRAGDLAYAHVHPIEDDTAARGERDRASEVRFDATLPSAGRYGLFFDFKHDGVVHTASFTFDQGAVKGTAPMSH